MVFDLLKVGRGNEISEMFENLLDDSVDASDKNVFNDRAKNALGECLTVVARMFEDVWKSQRTRLWFYDAVANVQAMIKDTDMQMIQFGRLRGIGRDGKVKSSEFFGSVGAALRPAVDTLVRFEGYYGIEMKTLSEAAEMFEKCLKRLVDSVSLVLLVFLYLWERVEFWPGP